jgi:hypothetical protein
MRPVAERRMAARRMTALAARPVTTLAARRVRTLATRRVRTLATRRVRTLATRQVAQPAALAWQRMTIPHLLLSVPGAPIARRRLSYP